MGGKGIGKITGDGEKEMIKKILQKGSILLVTGYWLLVTLTGCGYTSRSMISNKFRTIYITPFVNKIDITRESYVANKYRIYRPTVDTDITKTVINKFLFDGNLKPSAENSADLILKGELLEFRKEPLRYSDDNTVTEYRINLVVNLSLWDRKENRLVWQENNFIGDTTYFTTGTQAKTESAAITDALADLARRIVERTVEQW